MKKEKRFIFKNKNIILMLILLMVIILCRIIYFVQIKTKNETQEVKKVENNISEVKRDETMDLQNETSN